MEKWKNLSFMGYPNYEVSDLGRIKSLNYLGSGKEHIMSPIKHKNKYLDVDLCNGKPKRFLLHRLVAMAFVPNPNNYPIINHINENKYDARAVNLEWCDYHYNNVYNNKVYRVINNRKGSNAPKKTFKYDRDWNLVDTYNSINECIRVIGCGVSRYINKNRLYQGYYYSNEKLEKENQS